MTRDYYCSLLTKLRIKVVETLPAKHPKGEGFFCNTMSIWLKITKVANLLRQQINYKNYHFIAQVNISRY
jgi:hypothetical protein